MTLVISFPHSPLITLDRLLVRVSMPSDLLIPGTSPARYLRRLRASRGRVLGRVLRVVVITLIPLPLIAIVPLVARFPLQLKRAVVMLVQSPQLARLKLAPVSIPLLVPILECLSPAIVAIASTVYSL